MKSSKSLIVTAMILLVDPALANICPNLFIPRNQVQITNPTLKQPIAAGKVTGDAQNLLYSFDKEGNLIIGDINGVEHHRFDYFNKTRAVVDYIEVTQNSTEGVLIIRNSGNFARNHVSIWSLHSHELLFSLPLGNIHNVSAHFIDGTIVLRNRASYDGSFLYYVIDSKYPNNIFVVDNKKSSSIPDTEVTAMAIDPTNRILILTTTEGKIEIRGIMSNELLFQGELNSKLIAIETDTSRNWLSLTDAQGNKQEIRIAGALSSLKDKISNVFKGKPTLPAVRSGLVIAEDANGNTALVPQENQPWKVIGLKPGFYPWTKKHMKRPVTNYSHPYEAHGRVLGRSLDNELLAVEGANDHDSTYWRPTVDIEIYRGTNKGPELVATISRHQDIDGVFSVEFSPNKKNVILRSTLKAPKIYSLETGKLQNIGVDVPFQVSLSPSNRYILSFQRPDISRASGDTDILVYDSINGKFITRFKSLTGKFSEASFVNESTIIAREESGELVRFDLPQQPGFPGGMDSQFLPSPE